MAWTPRRSRRKGLVAGAVAALIAAVSILAIEATGTLLTEAHTGLGGKLAPSQQPAPVDVVPAAVPQPP